MIVTPCVAALSRITLSGLYAHEYPTKGGRIAINFRCSIHPAMGNALIQMDGEAATAETLAAIALSAYGHFTAIQVRDFAVQGLDLHLRRLDEANRELFG